MFNCRLTKEPSVVLVQSVAVRHLKIKVTKPGCTLTTVRRAGSLLPWRDAEISYRCVFALSVSSLLTALARNGQRRFSSDSWPGTRASSVHQATAQSAHRPSEKV